MLSRFHPNRLRRRLNRETSGDPQADTNAIPHITSRRTKIRGHECLDHQALNDGPVLGRDDPLWPSYIREAEKWDDIMMDKWNNSMDVLLLFATLFSAILTAFVVETSKNLQPDTSTIAATVLMDISETLRRTANGLEIGNDTSIPQLLDNFEPTTGAFWVNLTWFISLSLSIMVALVASLVKQWCNSFQSDRTAPPCNQARIRQARLNKLIGWRAELVVSALPIVMHLALGLFLVGLIIFLRDLNKTIYITVFVLTVSTGTFYLGTTVIPFFSPFCPFETPLSSLKVWGYCYQWFLAAGFYVYGTFGAEHPKPDFTDHISPCERQELAIANKTSPDILTGHALNWIIIHSQDSKTRDTAIRAIAGLKASSEDGLHQLIADPPGIFPQVIQSFTTCVQADACSRGGKTHETGLASIEATLLHTQALIILVNLVNLRRMSNPTDWDLGDIATWGVDGVTIAAVEERLIRLASDRECKQKSILGFVGLSSWYEFGGHSKELRPSFNRADIIVELAKSLNWLLPPHISSMILHALLVEFSYWAPNTLSQVKASTLSRLVSLVPASHDNHSLRSQLASGLAVLTLRLNRGATRLRAPGGFDQHQADPEAGNAQPLDFARALKKFYINDPNNAPEHEEALLLLAFTGLLEHYEHNHNNFGFDKQLNEDSNNLSAAQTVAEQLWKLNSRSFDSPQPVTLPKETQLNFDLREYFVDVLALWLQRGYNSPLSPSTNKIILYLLKATDQKHYIWVNHGSFLDLPVLQVLSHTTDVELQLQCLSACVYQLELRPSIQYANMLFSFDVPYRLIEAVRSQEPLILNLIIRRKISFMFRCISELASSPATNPEIAQTGTIDDSYCVLLLHRLMGDDLLEVFVRYVLNPRATSSVKSLKFWGGKLFDILRTPKPANKAKLPKIYTFLNRFRINAARGKGERMRQPGSPIATVAPNQGSASMISEEMQVINRSIQAIKEASPGVHELAATKVLADALAKKLANMRRKTSEHQIEPPHSE